MEVTKVRIIDLIEKLDPNKDFRVLFSIETILRKSEIDERLETLRFGCLNHLDSRNWNFFEDTIRAKNFGFAELTEYFDLLEDPEMKISPQVFKKSCSGRLLDLIPDRLRSNEVFRQTLTNIIRYSIATASGQGAGELFFLIYGEVARKLASTSGADIDLNGWRLEIKSVGSGLKNTASTSKSTQGSESRMIDDLTDSLRDIIRENRSWGVADSSAAPSLVRGWFVDFWWAHWREKGCDATIELMNHYISSIYKVPDATSMAINVLQSLGTPDANRVWSSEVITMNKLNGGWDSVLLINTKDSDLEYCNFIDGESVPANAVLKPVLKRGSGTFAYPDGYISLNLLPLAKVREQEVMSQFFE